MPVCGDSSIVPDSTVSSSPPTTPVIKRAARTYGRPRCVEEAADSPYTSYLPSSASSGSRDGIHRTGPPDVDEQIPPSSDPAPSDDENQADASPKVNFGWKQRAKALDDSSDVEMDTVLGSATASQSRGETLVKSPLSPRKLSDSGVPGIPTSPAKNESLALTDDVFDGASLNTITVSQSSTTSAKTTSPDIGPSHRRAFKRVIRDSDSEDDLNKVSPATVFTLATPKLNSSPTPPTSDDDDDDEMNAQPRPKSTAKGKRKATAFSRRGVPPLQFSEDETQATSKKRSKVKAPTKKDLAETARVHHRIVAEQQISIPRQEGTDAKYTLKSLLSLLVPPSVSSQVEIPDLDPIGDFSSDGIRSPARHPVFHTAGKDVDLDSDERITAQGVQLSPKKPLPDLDSDSDEMPNVDLLIAQNKEKHEKEQIQRRLREIKMKAWTAQSSGQMSDDDADELEIVQSLDMQMAVKEEDAERKSGRKKRISEGRKRQLNLGKIGLAMQKAHESPTKGGDGQFEKRSGRMQRGKPENGLLTQAELNKRMAKMAEVERMEIIRKKEEEWLRRGGKINTEVEGAASTALEAAAIYAERGLKMAADRKAETEVDDEDESDEDWAPARATERGSASPSPKHDASDEEANESEDQYLIEEADTTMVNEVGEADDMEYKPLIKKPTRRSTKHIVDSDSDGENHDENTAPKKASLSTFTSPRLRSSPISNDENAMPPPMPKAPMMSHRRSMSSMDDPTEDEGDKENDTSRMWDRGDDKENTAVVRYTAASGKPSFGTRKSSLFGLENDISRALSMSPTLGTQDVDADDEGEDEENRRPFKDLLSDDPFASAGPSNPSTSFAAKLQQASPVAMFPSTTPLALAPFLTKNAGLSQFDDESVGAFDAAPLEPGFSDLFDSTTQKQKTASRPLGIFNFSSSFSDESDSGAPRKPAFPVSLGLTQDIALQPAFQVGGNLLRRADQIFEKEQGYLLEAAARKPPKEPELYVNDHGFLTQTRPDVSSPEIYKRPSPTQNMPSGSEPPQRRPLRDISFSESVDLELDSPAPLHRLRKRDTTPTPSRNSRPINASPTPSKPRAKNAFEVMAEAAKTKRDKPKGKLDKSEFIENEAQESDDDEMLGFGPKRKDDEDEEDGEDLDKTLEALVDDQVMDEETIASERVREKFQEQQELEDQELEKLHQAAVRGEMRQKKRNHGVGMEDSDDDSDEDDRARKIRRDMYKKRKIDRDNIKELGEHPETRSFFQVYEQDLNNDDVGFLQEPDVEMANPVEAEAEDKEEELSIDRGEVIRRLRETAQQRDEGLPEEEPVDPDDISWIHEDDSGDEGMTRVKEVTVATRKPQNARHSHLDQMDLDAGFELPPSRMTKAETSMRAKDWAKQEGRTRNAGTTGRSVGGAAVTGHKVKAGGGSLRNKSMQGSASSAPSKSTERPRPVKAQPSLLAGVADERRKTRFG